MTHGRYLRTVATLGIRDLLDEVRRRPPFGDVRVVAVDGPSGSGKSTLAARLATKANARLLWGDDFLSWPDFVDWWPRFQQQVLEPLARQQDARYQARDWQQDEFGTSLRDWKTLPWTPLVVVEGVTFARSAAGARIAYRVWVEAPDDVRLVRGLERDGESHRGLWLDWMSREREFFRQDRTRSRADVLVDGAPNEPHDPDHEVVVLEG